MFVLLFTFSEAIDDKFVISVPIVVVVIMNTDIVKYYTILEDWAYGEGEGEDGDKERGSRNEWCFRPQFYTLRLYWVGDNLG